MPEQSDPIHTDDATFELLDRALTAEDLEQRTAWAARPPQDTARAAACAMVFVLGDEHFALAAAEVGCVRHPTSIHTIPHRSNDIVRGLCNIDGELLICMNLAGLLRVPAVNTAAPEARFVVIGSEQARWAFEVAAVTGMFTYGPADVQTVPLTVGEDQRHYSTTVLQLGEIQATRLDLGRVVPGFEAALR